MNVTLTHKRPDKLSPFHTAPVRIARDSLKQPMALEVVDLGPFEAEEVEVTVEHHSYEMSRNAFRSFGINE